MILLLDDRTEIHNDFSNRFKKIGIDMPLHCYSKTSDIKSKIDDLKKTDTLSDLKGLIIDLSNSKEEDTTRNFSVRSVIEDSFSNNSIPIFIHSGYLQYYEDHENLGTIIKVKKTMDSVEKVCQQLKIMIDSNFINIFGRGGTLEKSLLEQIHNAFVQQFKGSEINDILNSIHSVYHSNVESFKQRTNDTFQRIAIRAFYQNLISAKTIPDSNRIEEIKLNNVEHFYRRTSDFPVWTGDIFKNKKSDQLIFVLTPRCDINNGYCKDRYLVCNILEIDKKKMKDPNKLGDYINDNPQNTGIKYRYLTPNPLFSGGKVDLTDYYIYPLKEFKSDDSTYEYVISCSDELTNEITRKFASYIQRGGVSATEIEEATFYAISTQPE